MAVYRMTARRSGDGTVLSINIPAAMTRALPPGNHEFDVEFVEAGIMLTYVGPKTTRDSRRGGVEDKPKWVST